MGGQVCSRHPDIRRKQGARGLFSDDSQCFCSLVKKLIDCQLQIVGAGPHKTSMLAPRYGARSPRINSQQGDNCIQSLIYEQ